MSQLGTRLSPLLDFALKNKNLTTVILFHRTEHNGQYIESAERIESVDLYHIYHLLPCLLEPDVVPIKLNFFLLPAPGIFSDHQPHFPESL